MAQVPGKRQQISERAKKAPRSSTAGPPSPVPRPPATQPSRRLAMTIVIVGLAIGTAGLYRHALDNGFVNFDDTLYITENPHITAGLTGDTIRWAFSTQAAQYANIWHPLTWLSILADVQLFGLSPAGHHASAVALHTLTTLLLMGVLWAMTGSIWRSALVAALFAWHPLHVESVAWASERKDVLSGLMWVVVMWAYVWYVRRPGAVSYVAVAAAMALGLMAKPMLVTLPFVLLLLDYWPLGRLRLPASAPAPASAPGAQASEQWEAWRTDLLPRLGRLALEKLPLMLLAVAGSVVAYMMQAQGGALRSEGSFPIMARLLNAVVSYGRYLGKTFWPTGLAAFYPHPRWWPWTLVVTCAAVLVVVTAITLWQARRRPYLVVGWLWFLGTLVPVIGLVQVGNFSMADRFSYIPLIGVFIMIAWSLGERAGRRPMLRLPTAAAAALALAACAGLTFTQIKVWHDTGTLFGHALAINPKNDMAHYGLANHYKELASQLLAKGDKPAAYAQLDLAIHHFDRAIELSPTFADAHGNKGTALIDKGQPAAALEPLQKALAINRRHAKANYNLALALEQLGQLQEAERQYRHAIQVNPRDANPRVNLGALLENQRKLPEAVELYRQALTLNPRSAEAHYNLAHALAAMEFYDQARQHYMIALELRPNFLQAHHGLGSVLLKTNSPLAGVYQYRLALALDPQSPVVLLSLSWTLSTAPDFNTRNGPEAVVLAERAVRVTGGNLAVAWDTLGAAHAEVGQFEKAIQATRRAIDLAHAAGNKALAEQMTGRVNVYKLGQPWREK